MCAAVSRKEGGEDSRKMAAETRLPSGDLLDAPPGGTGTTGGAGGVFYKDGAPALSVDGNKMDKKESGVTTEGRRDQGSTETGPSTKLGGHVTGTGGYGETGIEAIPTGGGYSRTTGGNTEPGVGERNP